MNRNKLMLFLAGVAALIVIAGGYFLGISPQYAHASEDSSTKQSVDASNATAQLEIGRLRAQAAKLGPMEATLADLKSSVPATPETSSFIKELNDIAGTSGVTVSTITVGDAQAYASPESAAGTGSSGTSQAAGTATASSSPSASASATATPSPAASPSIPTPPQTTTNSLITAANYSVIPVSVSVDGSFDEALSFVKGAQSGARLFLINSISSSTSGSTDASTGTGTAPTWTFAGYVYVLSGTAPAAATNG